MCTDAECIYICIYMYIYRLLHTIHTHIMIPRNWIMFLVYVNSFQLSLWILHGVMCFVNALIP